VTTEMKSLDELDVPTKKTGSNQLDCEVVVVGAGPYGLSAASHLKSKGFEVRVFGKPMDFWATKMPEGMLLRSPRVASNISDPKHAFQLPSYETASGIPAKAPLPLSTFVDYGQWFQRQLIPDLDQSEVEIVERSNGGFRTVLANGTSVQSSRVVVAAGIGPFQRIPDVFKSLPREQVTHCYSGFNVKGFAGKKVVVIGAGQSALESAALLHEAGAEVEIIARYGALRWIGRHPRLHNLGPISKMLYSSHDVGPAGISKMVAAPNLMRWVPLGLRDKIRKRAVRPAGSPWLRPRLANVSIKIGRYVTEAKPSGSRVALKLDDGSSSTADFILLGTGYSVDISKFNFLSPEMLKSVRTYDGYPVLQPGFQTSLPGLHFVGAAAARSFGPLLYFVAGTEFASTALASSIVKEGVANR
jgi:thioredoxin reductase